MTFPHKEEYLHLMTLGATIGTSISSDSEEGNWHGYDIPVESFPKDDARKNLRAMLDTYGQDYFEYAVTKEGDNQSLSFFIPIEMDGFMQSGVDFSVENNGKSVVIKTRHRLRPGIRR